MADHMCCKNILEVTTDSQMFVYKVYASECPAGNCTMCSMSLDDELSTALDPPVIFQNRFF